MADESCCCRGSWHEQRPPRWDPPIAIGPSMVDTGQPQSKTCEWIRVPWQRGRGYLVGCVWQGVKGGVEVLR